MSRYIVSVTLTAEVTNPSAVAAVAGIAGSKGGDELSQIEVAVNSGLGELSRMAGRYGFAMSDASATVTPTD